jgi:hypothetical protein
MQFKSSSLAISDDPQILGPSVTGKIQITGVLNNQIFPGLSADRPRPFQVGLYNPRKIHRRMIEEPISGFEFCPVWKGLR